VGSERRRVNQLEIQLRHATSGVELHEPGGAVQRQHPLWRDLAASPKGNPSAGDFATGALVEASACGVFSFFGA
jgi:hypothetical protein